MDHFSHACLPWFVCGGLLENTGLGEDWELVVLMQNTFFSTRTLSSRSFPLSSPNSEVAVSIADVQDPLSLCSHALWFSCCFVETKQLFFWPQHGAEQLLDRFVHGSWCTGRKWWCFCYCWVVQKYKYLYRHGRIELCPGIFWLCVGSQACKEMEQGASTLPPIPVI